MIYGSGPVVMPHINGGRLRVIAVTTEKRGRALPNIPTVAESGVPGYEAVTWYGLMGPKGLPREVVARWQTIMSEALQSKEMKERFDADGLELSEIGTAHFAKVLKRDIAKWTKVVKAANIRLAN
jgi:tripartite-type tricarboxylate transporter receptor subunit TctC